MSTNKTTHYGLHLWEPEDAFVRTEFNENSTKTDAALRDLETGKADQTQVDGLSAAVELRCRMTAGRFTGNNINSISIPLPFPAKAALVERGDGLRSERNTAGGLVVAEGGNGLAHISGSTLVIVQSDMGTPYYYVAWG